MAPQCTCQGFGPFNTQIDGVIFNGRDCGLWNLSPSSQLALREFLQFSNDPNGFSHRYHNPSFRLTNVLGFP
jgi:hypothetical protein